MPIKSRKPILVTGSHRSGTTWVGKMISSSPSVAYVHEPFNINHDIGACGVNFWKWFTYISDANEQQYYAQIERVIDLRYDLLTKLKLEKDPASIASAIKKYLKFSWYRLNGARPLIKDPIAIFSSAWLAEKFDMDVVVLIRHPAAFAASLKVKKWTFPFSHFIEQPLLIQDYLLPYEEKIKHYAEGKIDIIEQAAFLWVLIHHVIRIYQQKYQNWNYVRHEDLSRDPVPRFKVLFDRLGLEFTPQIKEIIESHSASSNSGLGNDSVLKRNSLANIANWKSILTQDEVKRIKQQVQELASFYYSEDEW